MLRKYHCAGFTFTELLVALTLNALLFAALLSVFVANLGHNRKVVNTNRLNQQLQTALDVMTNDIRRAGYWANAHTDVGTGSNNNPFMAAGTDISVNLANNCILLAYDRNSDGALPAISAAADDERYGYRLINSTLQGRPPGATFSCTAAANQWENLTDPNFVQVSALTFTITPSTITTGPGSKGILFRDVTISLTGNLVNDNTVTRTLTQFVRIRNDKFIP